MMRALVWGLITCGLFAFGGAPPMGHAAAGPKHDVFERPKPRPLKQHEPESVKTQKPLAPIEWKPELRAIIQSGGNAWVNVEGRILQVGQDMDGFRLVDVQERRAVFVKDDVRYTLDLREIKAGSGGGRGVVRAVSEPASDGGSRPVADPVPAAGSKAVADPAAGSRKAATDPAPVSGGKGVSDPVPTGSEKRATVEAPIGSTKGDRAPLGTIKASAILPRPGSELSSPGRFAQVSER